ncbi:MAG: preprotein translocase, YajC subunit [Dehalococcoidales bacterium]|nr:preprotein translocase, YajC subunit [Dehalococcoidales bacterium]
MTRNRLLSRVVAAMLVLTLVFIGGCAAPGTAGGQESSGNNITLIILVVLSIGMFYWFMLRPTQQREKRRFKILEELQKGDTVITAGGIYGQVESMDEDSVVLKVESGATIRVIKGGILNKTERD